MRVSPAARIPVAIALGGDPLPSLEMMRAETGSPATRPALFVIGVDARRVLGRAAFSARVRRGLRNAPRIPTSVSHIIVVIEHDPGVVDSWMLASVHGQVLSIHRRIQLLRGIDADVAALLIDRCVDRTIILSRIEELAGRPPGVNPAAVLTAEEVRGQTIAQASTNDFI